jgi:hypothetical protein
VRAAGKFAYQLEFNIILADPPRIFSIRKQFLQSYFNFFVNIFMFPSVFTFDF